MGRIRQRLLNESAEIKRNEKKRKERQGKKYGERIQVEKLKERERTKRNMDERIKGLKRSKPYFWGRLSCVLAYHDLERQGVLDNAQADGDFDVAVEDAISDRPSKRAKGSGDSSRPNMSCRARDGKFGFGGAERRSKQNTNLPRTTLNLGGGLVVRIRSSERAVRVVKRHL